MRYNIYQISDLIEEISMGPFGSNIKVDCFVERGIPVLNGSNLNGFCLQESSFRYVTEEKADSLGRANAFRKDIVITHRGTLGQIVFIPENSKYERYVISQSQFRVRCNEKILPEYMVYYFHTAAGQHALLSNASQVGVPALARATTTFQQLEMPVPDMDTQKRVIGVLQRIQNKIVVDEKINKNLEEQAQAIYSKMFVEDADSSWPSGVLSDIAEITMGQSPKGDTYNEEGIGTVFFQGRAEFGFRFPTRRLYTSDPKRMAQTNDVLLSVRAPVGDLNVAIEPCCIGRGLGAIHSKDGHQSFTLYTMFALRQKLDMFNGEGTVFGSINRNALNSMEVIIPPAEELDRFEGVIAPMDATIRNNYDEICRLTVIRDSLLPRLMSGELDVSDLDF